jgi:hypothetical protein
VVSGPFWHEGPDFHKRHEIRPPKEFTPKGYSDNFLTFAGDFNGDRWADVLYVPWPGTDALWYESPAGKEGHWMIVAAHTAFHAGELAAWRRAIGRPVVAVFL